MRELAASPLARVQHAMRVQASDTNSAHVPSLPTRHWSVGELLLWVKNLFDARLNPVRVEGEMTGVTVAASGHVYFTLKDSAARSTAAAQLRCVMFKRAASLLTFEPTEGAFVELEARLDIYAPRGEMQLIVERLRQAGQGTWFEQFLRLKEKLERLGWFATERKRTIKPQPTGIAVVTSLQAAALHDVRIALSRRVPHIPVFIFPAAVQGAGAATELCSALQAAGRHTQVDVILLVRGGGAPEDLHAYNDETLAQAVVNSPIPVISGIGHESDFSITDFCVDLRAATPTAAAELCAQSRSELMQQLQQQQSALQLLCRERIEHAQQSIDRASWVLRAQAQQFSNLNLKLGWKQQRLHDWMHRQVQVQNDALNLGAKHLLRLVTQHLQSQHGALQAAANRLHLLAPERVLERGYAWVSNEAGQSVESATQVQSHQKLNVRLAQGQLLVQVTEKVGA